MYHAVCVACTFGTLPPRFSKTVRSREVLGKYQMQEFYFDPAYLAFQKAKLAELDVGQIARDRLRRIEGRKRVRQDHKTYADNLREYADTRSWKKPKSSVLKENANMHKERKDATLRMAVSRSQRAAASQDEVVDVFSATDALDWGSQASQRAPQVAPQVAATTAPRLWATHPLPFGLRPERSALPIAAVAQNDEVGEDEEDENWDLLAAEFSDKVHAKWLSEAQDSTNFVQLSDSTSWSFQGAMTPDNWAFTGHLLARNISHATLEKTKFLFVTGKSERKRSFRTLMCKVSTALGKRKTALASPDFLSSFSALTEDSAKYSNDLWSGEKRRTSTKRTLCCQVQLRLHHSASGVWKCRIGSHVNHNHPPTAAAAPVIVPSEVADACQQLHVTATLSLNQASRLCVASCKSFIPRSTLRSLLRTCTFDETWGQGGQAGLLLELILNSKIDLCAQFQKTTGNRIEAMVTVARLSGEWTIVEGGLIQARKEYFGMVITIKRLEKLHRRHPTQQLADRICAARAVLNTRLAPSSRVEVAPGMACSGDYFEVSETSHADLIQLNAVLLTAFGQMGPSKLRVTHLCYCTPEDREHAMMHPHKVMLDTTCKTNAGKKHFGYLSGNTTNHNWFKW